VDSLQFACVLVLMWGFPFSDSLSVYSLRGGYLTIEKCMVMGVRRGTHFSAPGIWFPND